VDNPIIVALDLPSPQKALKLAEELAPFVGAFKVGKQLFVSGGPDIVRKLRATGAKVFLDVGCDRFFRNGMDRPLEGAQVMLHFANGAELTGTTASSGLAYLSGFDASAGVVARVSFPPSYRGYRLEACPNSPATIALTGRDFSSGSKLIQFRARAVR